MTVGSRHALVNGAEFVDLQLCGAGASAGSVAEIERKARPDVGAARTYPRSFPKPGGELEAALRGRAYLS